MSFELQTQSENDLYTISSYLLTGLTAVGFNVFYTFPAEYGDVNVYAIRRYAYKISDLYTWGDTSNGYPFGINCSVWDEAETDFKNGYFFGRYSVVADTDTSGRGIVASTNFDNPIRVNHTERLAISEWGVIKTVETGGYSNFDVVEFRSVANQT